MIKAGCELVRLTAPSKTDAENLKNIKDELSKNGYSVPLVADIHFTPNAAEIAAGIVEKVRVNPGNYADKKRFEHIEYTNESYLAELERIEEKFTPLVLLCKKNKTAMRIGTNHGSLSDRILSRYGDTPEGMVESAMEFIRICEKNNYHEIVLSMKASNTLVMVEAYRLLVHNMIENNMNYPIHLGVTEAGEGEDGRIKSAVGIGALLEDGIGDTIRVSLTEAPEEEMPVARKLLLKYDATNDFGIDSVGDISYDPFHIDRFETNEVLNIGGKNVPVVVGNIKAEGEIKPSHFFGLGYAYSVPLDKWNISDLAADYVYIGDQYFNFELPGTVRILADYTSWEKNYRDIKQVIPYVKYNDPQLASLDKLQVCFIEHPPEVEELDYLQDLPNAVIVLNTQYSNKTQLFRYARMNFAKIGINNPVILGHQSELKDNEQFQLWSSADTGSSFIDGFGNGIWLQASQPIQLINSTAFAILQATRSRISKTEYISCPSCGRTLFDLQITTAKIRARTSHLKGIKIGIMGCIVNGPGEMADADYGYVGTGPGKIHLYKEKEVVRKNVPEHDAVDALISLIKENGDWVDPVN